MSLSSEDKYNKIRDPVNISEAKSIMIRCLREKAEMEGALSGCDWCCGGGDEAMGELLRTYDNAVLWLSKQGVIYNLKNCLCTNCTYYDQESGNVLCKLCNDVERQRRRDDPEYRWPIPY